MQTLLSQIFITERHRLRAGNIGHSVPLASEVDIEDLSVEPLMITTTRGTFLESRVSLGGYARFGFSECLLDQEATLIREFHRVLVARSQINCWSCVAGTIDEALALLEANGVTPSHLAGGSWSNYLTVGGAKVLDAGFPAGTALLVAAPSDIGLHTRVGNYVGIVAYRVNRCFVAVVP